MLGVPLSVVIGYFLAGWLNELYGWRVTFMLLGLPGLVLAVLGAVDAARAAAIRPRACRRATAPSQALPRA